MLCRFFVTSLTALLSIVSVTAYAANALPVKAETLLISSDSWDGTAYERYPAGPPELTVVRLTIAPNTTLPWHTHPMPSVAYVISGELLVEKQGGDAKKRLLAGDVLPEMVRAVHRGVTGETGVVLIVFYAGAKGMKLSEPPGVPR